MTAPIVFLPETSFSLDSANNLNVDIPGFSIVLFFSTRCKHCSSMQQTFIQTNMVIDGCTFAMCNVEEEKGLIGMCSKSNCAITYVPYIVFFANKKAYMVYGGGATNTELVEFIVEVSKAYRDDFDSGGKFDTKELASKVSNSCAIADADCLDKLANQNLDTCYVSMEEAYGGSV